MQLTSIKFRKVVPFRDRIETYLFEANAIDKTIKYTLLKTSTESVDGSIKSFVDKPILEKSRTISQTEVDELFNYISNIDFAELSNEEIKKNGADGEQSIVFCVTSIEPLALYYKELGLDEKPSNWTEIEKLYNYINTLYPYDKKKRTFWEVKELQ